MILKMWLLYCPVHQNTDTVDFTGNLMIINYLKYLLSSLFSVTREEISFHICSHWLIISANQYISQALIQKHKIVNAMFKCPNNVYKT